MNNRDLSFWLVPILATLAIYFPAAPGRAPESTPIAVSAAQIKKEPPKSTIGHDDKLAEKLLRLFLGPKSSDIRNQLSDYRLTFLTATVPDPTDSGLGHLFDAHMAAIQRGAEAAGYVLDRFEIPWNKETSTKDDNKKLVEGAHEVAKYVLDRRRIPELPAAKKVKDTDAIETLPRHQRDPGLILFRKPYEKRLLLLFLIGETPTLGVHKPAFLKALAQIKNMCEWGRLRDCGTFRVLAPSFSGSADSLKIAIQTFQNKQTWRFNIITGSATAINKEKFLDGIEGSTHLSETIAQDKDAIKSFLDFVKNGPRDNNAPASILDWMDRMARNKNIAFLVEAGTGYGQTFQQERDRPIIRLSYPVHISQLRKASEKARATEKGTNETPRARPRDLKLSLEEGDDPKDILPPFSQFETFSVELVLHNIFATIAKEGIRYVGLFSTDIRDQIFLANAIRRRAPNVVLFTVGADLLYLHSDVNADFNGMLLITTYPLFNKNQIWTPPFKGEEFRIQFPNDTSQGVYNATLALLGEPEKMVEYPFFVGEGFNPVWLAVVGKDNFWPIKYFSPSEPMGSVLQTSSKDPSLYSKRLFFVLCLLMLVCLLLSSVLILDSFTVSSNRFIVLKYLKYKLSGLLKLFGDTVSKELRYERRIHLFALAVGLLMVSIIVSRLFARYLIGSSLSIDFCNFREPVNLFPLLALGLPVLTATILVGWKTFYSAYRSITVNGFGNNNLLLGFLLFLVKILPPLFVLALSLSFASEICGFSKTTQFFFNLRMLNIGNGISPLPPLFFIAGGGFLYLVCSFRRLRLLEELQGVRRRITRRLILRFSGRSFVGLAPLQSDVTYLLGCSTFQLPFAWLIVVFVGVPCSYVFVIRLVPSIEGNSFYLFFGTAFFLIYMALAFTLLRFFCVWWATRRVLTRLEAHPIQGTFKNLAGQWINMPRLDLSVSFNPFIPLDFSLTKATELSRRAVQAGSLRLHAEKAENFVQLAHRSEEQSRWPKAMNFRRSAQAALAGVSKIISRSLESSWRDVRSNDKKKEQWLEDARLYLAAQCVTFLLHVFSQLKNLISFVFVGLLLMLVAVNSYPFQPREWILWFNWLIILAAVVSTMFVFVQINRDSILSHLSDTTPGRLSWTWDFITKTLVYGAVPLLALLSAQFPESLRQMVSWFGGLQAGH